MASMYDELQSIGYKFSENPVYPEDSWIRLLKATTRKPGMSYTEVGQKAFDRESYNWPVSTDTNYYTTATQARGKQFASMAKIYSAYKSVLSPEIAAEFTKERADYTAAVSAQIDREIEAKKAGKFSLGDIFSPHKLATKVGAEIARVSSRVGDEIARSSAKVGEEVARPVESLLGQDAGNFTAALFEEPGRIAGQATTETGRVAGKVTEETGRLLSQSVGGLGEKVGAEVDRGVNKLGEEGMRVNDYFSVPAEEPLPALDPAGPAQTTSDVGMGDPLNTRFFETVGKGRKRKGKGRSATIFGGQGEGVRPSLLSMKNTGQPKQLLGA